MNKQAAFLIENQGSEPFKITECGRVLETLNALRNGEVPPPAYTRRSDHVFRLRQKGVCIETEMRRQKLEGRQRFGVYHLNFRITQVFAKGRA